MERNITSGKPNLLDMQFDQLADFIAVMGLQRFRAEQIYKWLNAGIRSFDDMKNVPKNIRENLEMSAEIGGADIAGKQVSKIDGTVKYLFRLYDGEMVEGVTMEYAHGSSICISSQVGCKMGCIFCASSATGFVRDLTSGEMLGQVLCGISDSGKKPSNIVIMGIGEPLDNYENLISFLKQVNHPKGLNIGYRHATVSTCGIIPGIIRLSDEDMPITLSVSLHASDDDTRNSIMPVNRKYSIDKIIDACKIYTRKTGRRLTFEYALISGVNDSKENAMRLAGKIHGMLCHVNLIPVNEIDGNPCKKSDRQTVDQFREILESRGIPATIRRKLGNDIEAACGQLRRKNAQGGV
jgi:23S rRNA (adenine2503-C2)-methyltransferase